MNVLGIRRSHDYILKDLSEERLRAGDVLLVQGSWTNIGQLANENDDWVVLGQPKEQAQKVILTNKAPIAGAIMLLMVAMMMFDFIPHCTRNGRCHCRSADGADGLFPQRGSRL